MLTIYYSENLDTYLKNSVFVCKKTSISSISFSDAFRECKKLTSISFPKLTSAGSKAFYYAFLFCSNLTSVSFPELTSAGSKAFYYAFQSCSNLTSVSFPKLTSVSSDAFNYVGHSNLTIHLPKSLSSSGLSTGNSFYGTIVYDL